MTNEEADPTTRDLLVLRSTLARELDTINEYERMLSQAGSPEVRRLLAHLRDEEKEHVAECMIYIRRLDPVQERFFQIDVEQLVDGSARKTAPQAGTAVTAGPGVLTVGSLKGRRG